MEGLENLDLFALGIAIASIGILGFIVFFNNRRSITNQTFLFFSLFTVLWSTLNFLIPQFQSPTLVLGLLRLSVFFAVLHAFSFFQLFYVFPKEHVTFSKKYRFILLPIVIFTAFFIYTPFVFVEIAEFSPEGQVTSAVNGPGIVLFGLVVTGLIIGGLSLLFIRTRKALQTQKAQFRYILIGSFLTFSLLLIFNFVFPAFFDNTGFIPLAPLFFLPFLVFTAYSIVRYHLFNIKILATSVLTLILAIVMLFEVLLARDLGVLVFRVSIFFLVLSFGILLIRSVRREVEQREELEVLTKKIAVANSKLKRLDAAKSEFISIASHQLRTPLTAVKGYISLVIEGSYGKLPEKMRRPIRNVYDSNERLIRLVNDLLSLSRMESGKMEMDWETVKIQDIIESVIQELNIKATQKNLKLIYQKSKTTIPLVKVDRAKIRNVILNIIDNAIKYTNTGSITTSILLEPQKNPKNLVLRFKDTGAGMSAEELERLFQSFTRGSAGVKNFTEGTGLGLYIAKQFVEMHNGTIRAESEGKGKGSSFLIQLPLT